MSRSATSEAVVEGALVLSVPGEDREAIAESLADVLLVALDAERRADEAMRAAAEAPSP